MKNFTFTIIVCLLISMNGFSQSVTSVSNGNWLNPMTWSCTCIPVPGYTATSVTINHSVVLDTSMILPSGTITVGVNGILSDDVSGRDLHVNGGTLINNGLLDFRYLYAQSGSVTNNDSIHLKSLASQGTFVNNGTIYIPDSMYISGNFSNNGTINAGTFYNDNIFQNHGAIINADSISNAGTFTNYADGSMYADSMTNTGTLINDGSIFYTAFTNFGTYTNNNYISFYDFTNIGNFNNNDSLIGTGSFTNIGDFTNNTGSRFELDSSFLNADTLGYHGYFFNNGIVLVGKDWFNSDTINGTENGSFVVQNLTGNSGIMKGTFDFCDLTPPAVSPFIDYNTGIIEAGITYCAQTSVTSVEENKDVVIYPNPANNKLFINREISDITNVEIYNTTGGKEVFSFNREYIDLSGMAAGMYFIKIKLNNGNNISQKFLKEK